jgi:hypothetical protein
VDNPIIDQYNKWLYEYEHTKLSLIRIIAIYMHPNFCVLKITVKVLGKPLLTIADVDFK